MVGEERHRDRGVTVGEKGIEAETLTGVVLVEKNSRFVVTVVVLRKHRRKMSKFNKRFPCTHFPQSAW